ncbi:hypothetical protein MSPP1_001890 [Malassezia sp. CBS 17886]|nr:hypothetical protein MSPP1_001890 [Malassezia sp. CBS 17886]
MVSIPKLAVQRMRAKYPQWAAWYKMTYLDDDDVSSQYRPMGLSQQELDDLGGLAKLLQKHPSGGAPAKKRRADEYDVGSYDTKDPFVDDSELRVDEPTHIVKTSSDGYYVAVGSVELAHTKGGSSSRSFADFRSARPDGASASQHGSVGQINKLLAKRAASRRRDGRVAGEPAQKGPERDAAQDDALRADTAATAAAPADSAGASAVATPPALPSAPRAPSPASAASAAHAGEPVSTPTEPPAAPAEKAKKNKYPTRPVHPQLQQMFDQLRALAQRASFAVKTKFPPELKPPLVETAKLAVELDEYNENFFNYLPTIFPYNRFTMMKLTKREFFHKHMEYYTELQEEHLDRLYTLIRESFPKQVAEHAAMAKGGRQDAPAGDDARDADGAGGEELSKRFRWSEEMRDELFTVVTVENAMSEIRNEKLTLESAGDTYSEINARKALYKRIADFVPEDGWLNTTNVSREYGQLKKRRDRDVILDAEE